MVETRALSPEEAATLSIFQSSYRATRELRLTTSGTEPELHWKLTEVPLRRPVVRQLDGDSLESLAELYGPAEELKLIGAFDLGVSSMSDARIHELEDLRRNRELIGLLTWKYERWNETAWLCDIRVRENHRGKGIGSRLMEDVMWAAMRVEARGIMLETQTTNVDAVQFYLRRGFRMVGFNAGMYGDPSRRPIAALYFWRSL